MAPRVVKGKVIIGNAGAEFPPYRGYFSAFDIDNGKELWRFYVVPGDPSKDFENKALERAAKTWTGDWWKFGGGGSIWDGLAYDPDTNLIYVGTGNGTPWSYEVRQGKGHEPHFDNLYIASVLAVNPDNGELKWHYQFTPADEWDYDATQHLMLADLRINGRDRKVVMQANKNGFFYVLDRITGELISAEPFAVVSWAKGIDMKTGRPIVNPESYYTSTRGVTVAPVQGQAPRRWPSARSRAWFTFRETRPVHLVSLRPITSSSHPEIKPSDWPAAARPPLRSRYPGSGVRPANARRSAAAGRNSVRLGSRGTEGTLVCARRRLERGRRASDRGESRVSGLE